MINGHELYMRKAFELGRKGGFDVLPNPLVGAIIVKNNKIIGTGFHEYFGGPHAEVNAINNSSESVEGATLYCNLEPCCHTSKKTPPCTGLLIKSKIKKVIISNIDPNPSVSGYGVKLLKKAGIEVTIGVLEEEGLKLNRVFLKSIKNNTPFIHLKIAQTLDGKIATSTGDSKWITDIKAREIVHKFRKYYDGVLIGRETLNIDDPELTVRLCENPLERNPYKIIIGNINKINFRKKLFSNRNKGKIVIVTKKRDYIQITNQIKNKIEEDKIKIISVDELDGKINLHESLKQIYKLGIKSILVEGGAVTVSEFIKKQLYDKMTVFIAPKIIGNGPSWYQQKDALLMSDAINLCNLTTETINNQLVLNFFKG